MATKLYTLAAQICAFPLSIKSKKSRSNMPSNFTELIETNLDTLPRKVAAQANQQSVFKLQVTFLLKNTKTVLVVRRQSQIPSKSLCGFTITQVTSVPDHQCFSFLAARDKETYTHTDRQTGTARNNTFPVSITKAQVKYVNCICIQHHFLLLFIPGVLKM